MLSYQDSRDYLVSLQTFGIKLGLEQTRELFAAAGNPEKRLKFIHLAGSNGKGSCAAMLNAALSSSGFSTGFYSSPHLISPRERFRVNGQAISRDDFAELVSVLKPTADKMAGEKRCPTYFEFTTAMAALYFARREVDFVLWETGMGGRFDSTNVVDPVCSVITGIALDHQDYLGDTLEKITFEKAGIIKAGRPVICGPMSSEALAVVKWRAREVDAPLLALPDGDFSDLRYEGPGAPCQVFEFAGRRVRLLLPGAAQRGNFRTVYATLEYLCGQYNFEMGKALEGLGKAKWPGRCQFLPDGTIIDGAHNPDGIKALAESVTELLPNRRLPIIFGGFKDKDTLECLRILDGIATEFIFVPIPCDFRESRNAAELCQAAGRVSSRSSRPAKNAEEALQLTADAGFRLVAGSLFLAGYFLEHMGMKKDILDI